MPPSRALFSRLPAVRLTTSLCRWPPALVEQADAWHPTAFSGWCFQVHTYLTGKTYTLLRCCTSKGAYLVL